MSSYSERQAGAFAVAYGIEHKEAAPQFATKQVTFRNDVVHKGTFPTRADTITYGQAAFDFAKDVLNRLAGGEYAAAVEQVGLYRLRAGWMEARQAGAHPASYAMNTPLSGGSAGRTGTVEDALAEIQARPRAAEMGELAATLRQAAEFAAALRQVASANPPADEPGTKD